MKTEHSVRKLALTHDFFCEKYKLGIDTKVTNPLRPKRI